MSKVGRYSADRKKIQAITAALTASVADCGTVFTLDSGGTTGYNITLPNVSDAGNGWWCKFIVKSVVTNASSYLIQATDSDGDVIHGTHIFSSGSLTDAGSQLSTGDGTSGSAADRITVGVAAVVGDQVELVGDGTNWYATSIAFNHNGITYDK